jgi:hypothetical protein
MTEITSLHVGDPCPHCGQPTVRREASFYWRGATFSAVYCPKHGIWDNADDSFYAHVVAASKPPQQP